MPLTLTINTAEKRVQMLLSRGEELLHATDVPSAQSGAELLTPALRDACAQLEVTVANICRVACVAGPGGFTGLRLALTTAAGLARANHGKVEQAGLNYLQCLAASVPTSASANAFGQRETQAGQRLRVLVNARRGWLYWSDFEIQDSGLPLPLTDAVLVALPVSSTDEKTRANPFAAQPQPDFVLGSGLSNNRAWFEQYYDADTLLGPDFDHPSFKALLAMTQKAVWTSADVKPLYLRDCDAVENLDHIARTHGHDPEQAHAELRRLLAAELTNVAVEPIVECSKNF